MRTPDFDSVQHGRRRMAWALPALALGLVVPPLKAQTDVHRATQTLMGTRVELTLQGSDALALANGAQAALTEMLRLSNMMSRYRPTSALNAINLMAGLQPVPVPPELMQVLLMAREVNVRSKGRFDASIGSVQGWNFDARNPCAPTAAQVARQLPLVGQPDALILNEHAGTAYLTQRGMRLDLGGIAKLPILQAGMAQALAHGITNLMINGGGDVLVNGMLNERPWRIGLRDPRQPDQVIGTVALTRGIVAASGDYERFFMHQGQRMHHILDPRSGYPTHGPRGVALISEELTTLNGLGAAMMVAGTQGAQVMAARTKGLDTLIVNANNSLWLSAGMQRRLA